MKILSAEEIRLWDQYTIQHEPVTSLDLMERAAGKCADWLEENGYVEKEIMVAMALSLPGCWQKKNILSQ